MEKLKKYWIQQQRTENVSVSCVLVLGYTLTDKH